MTDVLIVEWLPRGGIAQTTETWRQVGREAGLHVDVIGRTGDELQPDIGVRRLLPTKVGALEAHGRLIRHAITEIRRSRPACVYVQHLWLPALEQAVLKAARSSGARTVLAVHNAAPHQIGAGMRLGMKRLLALADVVVTHSHHVRRELRAGEAVRVIPLPEHCSITRADPLVVDGLERRSPRRVVSFGVIRRAYKGTQILKRVADELGNQWEVVVAGVGAGTSTGPVRAHDRYLEPGELRWLVETADAVALPYTSASQSGAVSIAQSLGTPPVATAVGGISEQIDDGRTGVLVPPGSPAATWAEAVERSIRVIDRQLLCEESGRSNERAAALWLRSLGVTPSPGEP